MRRRVVAPLPVQDGHHPARARLFAGEAVLVGDAGLGLEVALGLLEAPEHPVGLAADHQPSRHDDRVRELRHQRFEPAEGLERFLRTPFAHLARSARGRDAHVDVGVADHLALGEGLLDHLVGAFALLQAVEGIGEGVQQVQPRSRGLLVECVQRAHEGVVLLHLAPEGGELEHRRHHVGNRSRGLVTPKEVVGDRERLVAGGRVRRRRLQRGPESPVVARPQGLGQRVVQHVPKQRGIEAEQGALGANHAESALQASEALEQRDPRLVEDARQQQRIERLAGDRRRIQERAILGIGEGPDPRFEQRVQPGGQLRVLHGADERRAAFAGRDDLRAPERVDELDHVQGESRSAACHRRSEVRCQ